MCGSVGGRIEGSGLHNRGICHCTDCRAFARFLGKGEEVLDAQGGTEIVQLAQWRLRFERGEEHLAAVRLSTKGILRWYAACCRTPIGNTLPTRRVSVIGLVHACLDAQRLDEDFGNGVAIVHAGSALGSPKPRSHGMLGASARLIGIIGAALITGRYRRSPLFDDSGAPRVVPRVLTAEELAELKADPGAPA
ncbi:DUF6151 family protein [Spiribacter halobius]|nr:DUF6151 family protein [Spiribacter halobius]UEX76396.1 DUF6151 family protein [Spiribacter halobius]